MSEERQPLDQQLEKEETEPKEEKQPEKKEVSEDQYYERQKEIASNHGWKPLEDFISDGGDPQDWVPAEIFNVKGEFIGKLREKDREVDNRVNQRLEGVKKLYEAQIESLKSERDQLIKDGDVDGVRKLDKQIDNLQTQSEPQPSNQTPRVVEEWNARNPWVSESTPRASYARETFARAVYEGLSPEQALQRVETEDKRHFQSKGKTSVPESEKGGGNKGFSKKTSQLTWDDLTADELKAYKASKAGWKDENAFLKAVADVRAQEGGK